MATDLHLVMRKIDERARTTISSLQLNGNHLCFILEDQYFVDKVKGITRIPAGSYEIVKRYVGKYAARSAWGFSLELKDVPNYTAILIHPGNEHEDTAGCLIPGTLIGVQDDNDYFVTSSRVAFRPLEKLISEILVSGHRAFIHIAR